MDLLPLLKLFRPGLAAFDAKEELARMLQHNVWHERDLIATPTVDAGSFVVLLAGCLAQHLGGEYRQVRRVLVRPRRSLGGEAIQEGQLLGGDLLRPDASPVLRECLHHSLARNGFTRAGALDGRQRSADLVASQTLPDSTVFMTKFELPGSNASCTFGLFLEANGLLNPVSAVVKVTASGRLERT